MSKVKSKLWAAQKPQVGDDLCRFFRDSVWMQWNWDSGPYPRGVDDMILG